MKKSVRIHLLVITTVVAIFAFAGIWYLRPGVPNELLEQARARQLQPLLEIEEPIRKPVAEPVAQAPVDKKALADELLPTLTDQVSRSLEGPLYEKLKKQFASDEGFVAQISARLAKTLDLGVRPSAEVAPAIPQGLQADFAQQVEALRTELLATLAEGQSSFFFQIEDMLDARLGRLEDDLRSEMQAYVPQMVDRMIPSLVEMLVKELDANKETYLPYLAQELQPYLEEGLTEEQLVLLYASYRDQIVTDLVPAILAAMEEPARKEVAAMVEAIKTQVAPVPAPPPTMTSFVKPLVMQAPVVEASPIPTPPKVVDEAKVVDPKAPVVEASPVPTPPSVVGVTKVKQAPVVEAAPVITPPAVVEPKTPPAPTVMTPKGVVVKPEPILAPPTFTPAEDAVEVFVDPVTYEQKRTEIRTKAIQEVLDRINAL